MKLHYVGNAPFFSALSEEEQERVSQRLHLEHHRSGQALFHKGDPSNTLYLIKSGWVRLLADGGMVLASQGTGSLVGESDVFLDRPRSCGASAASDVELWAISREDLVGLISDDPQIGLKLSLAFGERLALLDQYLIEQRLRPLPFFARLDDKSLVAIARRLVPMEIPDGSFVVERGQPPQGLFIVEAGQLHLHGSEEGGDFSELGAGESFGELAVVTCKPHARSVQAAGDVVLWVLSAADFEQVAAECRQIRLAVSQSIREPLLPEDQTRAVDLLGTMPLFDELSEDVLWAVADRLLLLHVPAGETVFSQGARGDALYILDDGQVEVISDDPVVGRTVIGRVGTDQYFGETELMTGKPRSNGARAVAHTNLWVLYRSDFDDLINRYSSISLALSKTLSQRLSTLDNRFSESHLRGLKLLAGLSPSQLEDVSRRLKPVRFRQGEAVVREGEPGQEMFFIESGRVRVLRQFGDSPVTLAELGAGDLFGEMALLTGSPRVATVAALSDLNLWVLSQSDFETLVTAYPNLALALSRLLSERLRSTDTRLMQLPAQTESRAGRAQQKRAPRPAAPARATQREIAGASTGAQRLGPRAAAATPSPGLLDEVFGLFDGLITWFSGLSTWGKIRLLVIVAALAWLLFIAAPSLVISTLAADNVTNLQGALAFVQTSTPEGMDNLAAAQAETLDWAGETPPEAAAARAQSLETGGAGAAPAVEAMGVTAMSAPDGAEPAPEAPEADTAQQQAAPAALDVQPQAAPTETPYIIVVTNTPLPPTETPLPPTETPVPPTNTPRPQPDVRPTAKPQPTATPAERPQPERNLDGRLSALNVNVQPTGVKAGQSYWRLVEARWADEAQAAGAHSIFINVIDENGGRLVGEPIEIRWGGGSLTVNTENKPANEYGANFPMYNTLGSYSVRVVGSLPSDVIVGLGLGTPQTPGFKVHTCFYLTFQRTTR